jgi:hypothetical protein
MEQGSQDQNHSRRSEDLKVSEHTGYVRLRNVSRLAVVEASVVGSEGWTYIFKRENREVRAGFQVLYRRSCVVAEVVIEIAGIVSHKKQLKDVTSKRPRKQG